MTISTIQVGISSIVGLNRVADVSGPSRPRAEYGQRERNASETMLLSNAQTLLPRFPALAHERIDIDVRAARHRPGGAEKGDVDQRVFDDLGRAHDRAAERIAQQHVNAE